MATGEVRPTTGALNVPRSVPPATSSEHNVAGVRQRDDYVRAQRVPATKESIEGYAGQAL